MTWAWGLALVAALFVSGLGAHLARRRMCRDWDIACKRYDWLKSKAERLDEIHHRWGEPR